MAVKAVVGRDVAAQGATDFRRGASLLFHLVNEPPLDADLVQQQLSRGGRRRGVQGPDGV